MHTSLQTVAISDITVNDFSFVVTEGRDIELLKTSIASCGLLQPPCLWRPGPEAGWIIVCGCLRVQAVRSLGLQELSAWVCDPDAAQADLLARALHDNLAHRLFNPVEKAHALERLCACVPHNEVIAQWLPRLGLTPSARTLERSLRLGLLEQEVRAALIAGSLTEASAQRLYSYSAGDRRAVFALMQQLHLSAGKQAELLEYLEDLARRDMLALREAAADPDLMQICADERLNRVQKTEQVRRILRLRRLPRLCAAEDRFAAALKELHLDAGIRLMPPPNFEGRTCRAEIAFTSPAELIRRCAELMQAAQQQAFKRLCADDSDAARRPPGPELRRG